MFRSLRPAPIPEVPRNNNICFLTSTRRPVLLGWAALFSSVLRRETLPGTALLRIILVGEVARHFERSEKSLCPRCLVKNLTYPHSANELAMNDGGAEALLGVRTSAPVGGSGRALQ